MSVQSGLETALEWLRAGASPRRHRETSQLLRSGRLGLVTNPSAVTDPELHSAPDALRMVNCNVRALFGPEHGVRGELADGVPAAHSTDPRTGLPVWSLYGSGYKPTPEMLQGLDALVFDIQDVGARFYTYASTLSKVMEAASEAKLPVIILDRPNPVGGKAIEGPLLEAEHASFVGLHPIPIRHAATMGELGRLWASFGVGKEPLVVPCSGWKRSQHWEATERQWIPPSPNMPTAETALVYLGTCLIEGTNVSEARGTACPFRWFGAPWIDAEALADHLNADGLPAVRLLAVRFRPTASKHIGVTCAGCQIHILDAQEYRPAATGVAILAALRKLYPKEFQWLERGGKFSVDRLAGTSAVRKAIDAGQTWQSIASGWVADERTHRARLEKVALY